MTRALMCAAGAMVVLAGCKAKATETGSLANEPVVTVGRENVAVATLTELRSGPAISGSLEAEQAATVRAEVAGSVVRTYAEAGEAVKRGAQIARLDDTAVRDAWLSARSAVRTAESSVENARRNAERAERLAGAGALPERDLENARWTATNAEGTLADARARLASAQEQLAHTTARAPFDGIMSERQADAGDVVQVGNPLFTVIDPTRLRLEASVPADQIGRLRTGTEVEFKVSGYDRAITGRIQRINPVVDPTTRQVRIYVSIPNTERTLAAGLFAEGRVATDTKRAVAVPVLAVDRRGTRPVVHRIHGGRVERSLVQLGAPDEGQELVEIISGVAEGDTVLLGTSQGIAEGSRVRVLEEEAGR